MRGRVKTKHQLKIRDDSQDRQPQIHSFLVRENFPRIMEQTNNDCRFRIFISTNSPTPATFCKIEWNDRVEQEELHRAQADERRRRDQQLLHEQLLKQNWDLREVHDKSLNEMEQLKKFQSSTFDTIARRTLVEDQDTILELTGKIQELQNEINCMNDSRCWISTQWTFPCYHTVSYPPHPVPGGMLRRSSGNAWYIGNVFANTDASSSALYPQELNPWSSHMSGTNSLITDGKNENQTSVQD